MSMARPGTMTRQEVGQPKRFVFVLLDNFTLLCFSAALESLRIANRMAGQDLYSWRIVKLSSRTNTKRFGCPTS
ncbi:MAG: hypothetical protein AAFY39_05350 [Pseudomonadota bacterium]